MPVAVPKRKEFKRHRRVGEALQQVIAEAIEREVEAPDLGLMTVTRVDAAPDLKHAKVYVSFLGARADPDAAVKALERTAGTIQREIARHMRLMWTPRLRFFADDTPAQADHIERILDAVRPVSDAGHHADGVTEASDGEPR